MSVEDLEAKKRELQLQRQIDWMEREKRALGFIGKVWRWALSTGLPLTLLLLGLNLVWEEVRDPFPRYQDIALGFVFVAAAWLLRKFRKSCRAAP